MRLLSCAASRFWPTTGFGRVGRAANLLTGLAGPDDDDHDADIGEDWTSLRALASRADRGGGDGVVARMGLDDKGEEMAGRWAEGEDNVGGAWLVKSGKIGGRPIVVNMARGDNWSTEVMRVVQDGMCIGLRSCLLSNDASGVFANGLHV